MYVYDNVCMDIITYVLNNVLAGPALFRGRLRAFGKCTNGVGFSKGRLNLASVRLTLMEKQYFTSVLMSIPLGARA